MLYNTIFSTLALLSLTAAAGIRSPKVLALPLAKSKLSGNDTGLPLGKRDEPDVAVVNQKYYYTSEIEIGTPGQNVSIVIDTGSSDLWVDNTAYNPSNSSTYHDNGTPFFILYGDGTYASGSYGTETISFGGATVNQANFAYASQSTLKGRTVFGVGYASGEATEAFGGAAYDNVPIQLKKQGIIDANAYSLWLNSWTDDEGSILFGGVDHALYDGDLSLLPIVTVVEASPLGGTYRPSSPTRLIINLNSISLSKDGNTGKIVEGAAAPVLLDSGSTYGELPDDWVGAIAASLGGEYDSVVKAYTLDPPNGGTLDIEFAGVTINVPLESFIRPIYLTTGGIYQKNGKDAYTIGVQGSNSDGVNLSNGDILILGDSFLSGAYIAYDLDNDVIAIANAKTGDITDSDIEAIGSNGIPGTSAPGYATATVSHTSYTLHTATGIIN